MSRRMLALLLFLAACGPRECSTAHIPDDAGVGGGGSGGGGSGGTAGAGGATGTGS